MCGINQSVWVRSPLIFAIREGSGRAEAEWGVEFIRRLSLVREKGARTGGEWKVAGAAASGHELPQSCNRCVQLNAGQSKHPAMLPVPKIPQLIAN